MLGLKVATDPSWAALAVANLHVVLADHAHCEMKAASNALALAARHPEHPALVRALSELAREELSHFEQVLSLLEARRIPLGPPAVDAYAARLRQDAAQSPRATALTPLIDRLLIAALIEARSCERFKWMIEALDPIRDSDVLALYRELFPAEARHYRLFLDLAHQLAPEHTSAIDERVAVLAEQEAQIVIDLARSGIHATMHG